MSDIGEISIPTTTAVDPQPTESAKVNPAERYRNMTWQEQAQERLAARMEGRDQPLDAHAEELHVEGRFGASGAFSDALSHGKAEARLRLEKAAGQEPVHSGLELQMEGKTGAMMEELMGKSSSAEVQQAFQTAEAVRAARAERPETQQRRTLTPEQIAEARERIQKAVVPEAISEQAGTSQPTYGEMAEGARKASNLETEKQPGRLERFFARLGFGKKERV